MDFFQQCRTIPHFSAQAFQGKLYGAVSIISQPDRVFKNIPRFVPHIYQRGDFLDRFIRVFPIRPAGLRLSLTVRPGDPGTVPLRADGARRPEPAGTPDPCTIRRRDARARPDRRRVPRHGVDHRVDRPALFRGFLPRDGAGRSCLRDSGARFSAGTRRFCPAVRQSRRRGDPDPRPRFCRTVLAAGGARGRRRSVPMAGKRARGRSQPQF